MACTFPLKAWRCPDLISVSGVDPSTGEFVGYRRRPLRFSFVKGYEQLDLPCGKCLGCRADQSMMWSLRAYHESTLWMKNCFVTLTYDDDNLPADGKISKSHLQKFFRALRDSGTKLRYIASGEYGELTRRPHYHAIIFGQDFAYDREDISPDLYTSPTLLKYWRRGHVSIAPVTMSTICYVCGYVQKKVSDSDTFSLMSRRPGIGHDFLNRFKDDLRRTGSITIEGTEYPIPRRYLMWEEDYFQDVIRQRRKIASESMDKRQESALNGKAANYRSRFNMKKEKL